MKVEEVSGNIHVIDFENNTKVLGVIQLAVFSDLHLDNPKCKEDILKKDLDFCLENNIPIIFNGDTFCLMQGNYDKRKMKSDIRPEHNNNTYFQSIVKTSVKFFKPYAHLIKVIGYGNHETSILKRHEIDILDLFVTALNHECNTDVKLGGYGGFIIIKAFRQSTRIKYFHGSGGGGIVTKGNINLTRALQLYEGVDVITIGHIHENLCRNDYRETVEYNGQKHEQVQKQVHLMVTGTYKEEYGSGSGGWHVERSAPIKPIGARILKIYHKKDYKTNKLIKKIDSTLFPEL